MMYPRIGDDRADRPAVRLNFAPTDGGLASLGDVLEHFTLIGVSGLTDSQTISSVAGLLDDVEQSTVSLRPLYDAASESMVFDGIDDYLITAAANTDYNPMHAEAGVVGCAFKYGAALGTNERLWSTASGSTTPGTYLILTTNGTGFLFGLAGAGYPIRLTGSTGISDTDWHTLICTHDGSNAEVYIDGVSAGSQAFRAAYDTGDCVDAFTLGAKPTGGDTFTGSISDLIFYTGSVDVAALHAELLSRVS